MTTATSAVPDAFNQKWALAIINNPGRGQPCPAYNTFDPPGKARFLSPSLPSEVSSRGQDNSRHAYPLVPYRRRLLYAWAGQYGVGSLTDQHSQNPQIDTVYSGTVAADSEPLILVDEADREIGHLGKAQCHVGNGVLHRAFSLLIFNRSGELLIQQRSAAKRLWPLYWSNSCCSHPRRAESMDSAIHRRLAEELGLSCPLHFLFKFQYHAQFDAAGAERELCSVYIGRSNAALRINRAEICAWRWIAPAALQAEMAGAEAARFTPWFRLEWERTWGEHRASVLNVQ